MSRIDLVDTTVRDGNQSLWGATGLDTGQMLQIAPVMDRVGFAAVDFTSSTHMAVAVRFKKENPWERIRLVRAAMPNTPLQLITTGMRFISWEMASPDLMRLVFRLLVEAGIRRFAVMDPMNDMAALEACARMIRQEGGEQIIAALAYTLSPVHDEGYYETCAAALSASPDVDRLYLKDPGGLLTPERAAILLPKIRCAWGTKPLELHSHCTIGLAPFAYMQAAQAGLDAVHTAVAPLANGTSQPSAERTVANLRATGHTVDIDDAALAEMSAYFRILAEAEGLPIAAPSDYDPAYFRHQVPGGMVTTMSRQLAELSLSHRMPAVYEETARVRAELGYPIMVTPFSQVIGTQAVLNVIGKARYASVPDEVIRYVQGRFGKPTGPVDPDVKDRILALPRAKELANEPPMPGLGELRRRLGPQLPDEELVLRAVMPGSQVDAMLAAGHARRDYDPTAQPILRLLRCPGTTHLLCIRWLPRSAVSGKHVH